jgi:hypothetical protein
MRNFLFLLFLLPFTALPQAIVDFDMDLSLASIGGHAEVTYTITNVSNSTVTITEIRHADAIQTVVIPATSSINPGDVITETNRIAISGDNVVPGVFFSTTSAEVLGTDGTNVFSELSDGKDYMDVRLDDGPSYYSGGMSPTYGVVYIDNDNNGYYNPQMDTPLPGVEFMIGNGRISTNEKGWFYFDQYREMTLGDSFATLDMATLPSSNQQYILIHGQSPTRFNGPLSTFSRVDFGFVNDGFGVIRTNAFLDLNSNGVWDNNERSMPHIEFTFTKDNDPNTTLVRSSQGSGSPVQERDFNPGIQLNDISARLTRFPNALTITTPAYDDIISIANDTIYRNFAVEETSAGNRDTSVDLFEYLPPNPGFQTHLGLIVRNELFGYVDGVLTFSKDAAMTIDEILLNGTDITNSGNVNITSTGFTFSYSLSDQDHHSFRIKMTTPTNAQVGDPFHHSASIAPTSADINSVNNFSSLSSTTVASFDPNDISEKHGEIIPINTFSSSDYLEYTIRFQNMGMANAQFVRVIQDLDPFKYDLGSIEVLSTSHSGTFQIESSNRLNWLFDNIQLPPQSVDENASQGFIKFRVKPNNSFTVGTRIEARAQIYFDYNPLIYTNIWRTTFDAPNSTNSVENEITIYPNPVSGNAIRLSLEEGDFTIFDLQGSLVQSGSIDRGEITLSDNLNSGLYLLKVLSEGRSKTVKLIKQ